MKRIQLTKNQKEEYSKIERKIQSIKKESRTLYKQKPFKQVKYATAKLSELYSSEIVRSNQNFLLRRYSTLEKRDNMWNIIWLPAVLSLLSIETIFEKINEIIEMISSLGALTAAIPLLERGEQIKCYVMLSIIALAIVALSISFWKLCEQIRYSLTRNADTTIIENEKCMIKALLIEHEILLDEGKEYERVHKMVSK